jgi:transposase
MARRSKVELFEQIRKAQAREGLPIRELSRRFQTHRRLVRQALASGVPPARKESPARAAPALGPWKETIDAWLAEDANAPRKQRHTARRVFERLVAEHGARIGESTVRRYVGQARRRAGIPIREVTVPQHHPLGFEAEVDFGDIGFVLDGVPTIGSMFVMRMSASGKAFHRVYLNEAQEVFLDGHVRAFEHFGGVPQRIRYDNLKPAVIRVLKGRNRTETDRFVALRSHYRFDSFFCQPGIEGAHEKGGVEGEIGRFRRRHLVPVPRVASMAELNELVARGDRLDDERRIFGRSASVAEYFDLERGSLSSLPDEAFDTARLLSCRVDTKSRICVRQCRYSVPVRYAGRRLDVALGAEVVEAFDGARLVARHPRARATGTEVLVLDHYLEVFQVKPGAFPGATALARARHAGAFSSVHDRFYGAARRRLGDRDGTRAMVEVLLGHRTLDARSVISGMERALAVGSVDPDVVLIEARRGCLATVPAPLPIGQSLLRFERPAPSLAPYDHLLEAR